MQKYYYGLYGKIKLIHNVNISDYNEYMSNFINKIMLRDEWLKEVHESKNVKGYVFSNLYPYESDGIYKKDNVYSFYINVFDKNLALRLKNCLEQEEIVVEINIKIQPFKKIKTLRTNSLCLISLKNKDKKFWVKNDGLALLMNGLNNNANLKHNLFLGEIQKETNFIQSLYIRSKHELYANYKNGKLVGVQLDIVVKDDEESQLLANICLATGLGEKNSLGCGYCIIPKEGK